MLRNCTDFSGGNYAPTHQSGSSNDKRKISENLCFPKKKSNDFYFCFNKVSWANLSNDDKIFADHTIHLTVDAAISSVVCAVIAILFQSTSQTLHAHFRAL